MLTNTTHRSVRWRLMAGLAAAMMALATCSVPEPEVGQTLSSSLSPRTPDNGDTPLSYGGDSEQVLDIYLPPGTFTGPHPLIVYVHGGAWVLPGRETIACVDRPECVPAIATQLDRGYVVASIDYRLAPSDAFPAQVSDVKLAIDWLRDNAATYDIDPTHVVLAGHSAGGHLATLAAITPGECEPSGVVATEVDAFVNLSGPTDLGVWADWGDPAEGHPQWIRDSVDALLGCTYSSPSCAPTVAAASPMNWVDASDPPAYLVCKDTDPFVPCDQLSVLRDAMINAHADDAVAWYDDVNCLDPERPVPCNDSTDNERHNPDWDFNLAALEVFLDEVTS